MTTQKPSYPEAPGFVRGSDTSKAASESIREKASAVRENAYRLILKANADGINTGTLIQRMNLPITTRLSPRIAELHKARRIVDSGKRSPNPISGKPTTVWIAAELSTPTLRAASLERQQAKSERMRLNRALDLLPTSEQVKAARRWRKSLAKRDGQ